MTTMMTFAQARVALTLEKETDKADLGHGTRAQVQFRRMNDDDEDSDDHDDILIKRCASTKMNDDEDSDFDDDDRCPTTPP